MSSGMNIKQAKEYAKTMTYREAVSNIKHAKGIKYRKATMIKIRELAEIADRLDRKTEPYEDEFEVCDSRNGCYGCEHHICKLEQTKPQIDCYMCKWLGEVNVCGRCRNRNLFAEANTKPQTIRCPKCGRTDYIREFGKDFSVTAEEAGFKYKCINCNTYIEPQTEREGE